MNVLKSEKLLNFIKNFYFCIKKEFKLSLIVFVISIFAGIFVYLFYFPQPDKFKELIGAVFGDLINEDINFKNMFLKIYERNVTASFIVISLGLFYKYLPLTIVIINGILIGIISTGMITLGLSFITLLQNLIPHGIFEIPAFLLASSIGIRLSNVSIPNNFKQRFKELINSKYLILTVLGLLLIAAIIESAAIVINSN